MAKRILIEWPDLHLQATATLADKENPELCQNVWDHLPIESITSHSAVATGSFFCWTPLLDFSDKYYKEALNEAPIGRMRYGKGDGGKIIIQYAELTDDVKGTVLGMIDPECIETIKQVGPRALSAVFLTKELMRMRVSRIEDPSEPVTAPRAPKEAVRPEVAKVVAKLDTELNKAFREEPPELKGVRTGKNPGACNQYFSTWEFVYGFLRDFSMYIMEPLTKYARDESIALPMLRRLYKDLAPSFYNYLGSWGLKTLRSLCQEAAALMDGMDLNRTEYTALIDAVYGYANYLGSWAYCYYPWGVGTCFRCPEK